MAGRVVYDSDDESDLSLPPSPAPVPVSRPPTTPRAMVAHMEPSPLPDTLSFTHPIVTAVAAAATSSTDPSFFQSIYDEQQRAVSTERTERDPWDVPSSPMRPPARPTSAKRKRDEAGSGGSGGSSIPEPKRQHDRQIQPLGHPLGHPPVLPSMSGLEISIPLAPLPSMHQYPRVLSSSISTSTSIDPSYPGEATYTLGRTLPALHPGAAVPAATPPLPPPPSSNAVTQSTVAFATPSIYASSGHHQRSFEGGPEPSDEVMTVDALTPPRQARAAAATAVMSSPDIIAEPVARQKPVAPSEDGSATGRPGNKAARAAAVEIDESDGSELSFHSSPGREPVIAASDDELDGGLVEPVQPVKPVEPVEPYTLPDTLPTASDVVLPEASKKPEPKAKAKRGRKKKEEAVVQIELSGQAPEEPQQQPQEQQQPPPPPKAKRPRGRPRQTAKKEYQGEQADGAAAAAAPADEAVPVAKDEPAAASKEEVGPAAKPTGKKGRPKKAVQAAKKATTTVDEDKKTTTIDDAALLETSGNARVASPVVSPVVEDDSISKVEEEPVAAAAAAAASTIAETKPVVSKPAVSTPTTAGSTASTGRVLYRVGLSKKTRIAPLLKIVRK